LGADEPIFAVITHDGQDIFDPSLRQHLERLKLEAVTKRPGNPWYVINLTDLTQ
jgi:hypothetical protein